MRFLCTACLVVSSSTRCSEGRTQTDHLMSHSIVFVSARGVPLSPLVCSCTPPPPASPAGAWLGSTCGAQHCRQSRVQQQHQQQCNTICLCPCITTWAISE